MMQRAGEALSDLEKAVELEPDNPSFLTNRAMTNRGFKRYDHALKDLNKALDIDQGFLVAHFNRGVLFFEKEDYAKAAIDFSYCILQKPEMEQAYFNRAFAYELLGNIQKAKVDLEKFIEISANTDAKALCQDKLKEWAQQ